MKTKFILSILALFVVSGVFAQGKWREKKEQVKTLKVAFITDELKLTTDEAEKFWPVYNQFEDRQFELRREKLDAYKKRLKEDTLDKMTDKEAATLLNQMEASEDELHQLRKKLIADLRSILPPLKIIKLKKAEEDFNKKLLKQYRENRK